MAYGDGNFGLSMIGMDSDGSAYKRLMAGLSKKVRVVMTDEYRTTKACPVCKDYWINWEKQLWTRIAKVSCPQPVINLKMG